MFTQQLPEPVLFHALKHHLDFIEGFVQESVRVPEQQLIKALRTIGSSQLDLYLGPLSPQQLAREAILYLQERQLLQPEPYLRHLGSAGFQVLPLSDGSDWTLRWGLAENRHVHLHPARYARHTLRVKANHLKSAIAAAVASIKYNRSIDLDLLNQVRHAWLALPPVKAYTSDEGLGSILQLVRGT
ncbi:hypothetical protein [Pontibacter akesuensis]|uniref:Uncharacterized protein n=1 Tax=Pontibacter akesuensis TaxID=388950 RepID=A0A1I7JP26_9BACT|nr:hypothetical protein [Pontibacter akesuensis]GHA68579.1 hypothetical protein GCM10007389_21970 [Pontibacter akesuensis]SFU86888.1 hypothetical protein SAMN04487941_3080 [Pontibacter akesuensis]